LDSLPSQGIELDRSTLAFWVGIDDVNRHPVIRTWSYKLAEVA
jgi:hypothetical protein